LKKKLFCLLVSQLVAAEPDGDGEHPDEVRFSGMSRRHEVGEAEAMTCAFVRLRLLPEAVQHGLRVAALLAEKLHFKTFLTFQKSELHLKTFFAFIVHQKYI
jgi:hypothetical protein